MNANYDIERLAGVIFGVVLFIGTVNIIGAIVLVFAQEWLGAGLGMIAAALSFTAVLKVLFK